MSLPTKSLAIQFSEFGVPSEKVRVTEQPVREPGAGEILIQMQAAPINPADINLIEGTYGYKPTLPAFAGLEGVGTVIAVGSGVSRLKEGDAVRPPEGTGLWQQFITVKEADCLRLPSGLPVELAAMIYVNPPTAWRMLHDFVQLQPGDWIIQNAANSAVGQSAIQIAKAKGWKTVNFVRREDQIAELKALGADIVLVDEPDAKKKLLEQAGKISIKLGLNCVGGDSATRVADCLDKNGVHVTYGAMSKQSLKLPNGFLIFKNVAFRGYWMTAWYKSATREEKEGMLAEIGTLIREGKFKIAVQEKFPLGKIQDALAALQAPGRTGKILLDLA